MVYCKECNATLMVVEGRRKKEFCNSTCRSKFWKKKDKPKTIELPKDYINFKNIGIINSEGKVEELKTIDQLPPDWVKAYFIANPDNLVKTSSLYERKVKNASKGNSKFKVYDYSAMPAGLNYAGREAWKRKARIEQDKHL